MSDKDIGYIVPHTHWDREWRSGLWESRFDLVTFIDELLDLLTQENSPYYFMLDGQSVLIDDYLQIKPEKRDVITKYIKAGRIAIGPWYTLPDLYPLKGECLVRNLMKGIRHADSFGGHLDIAYESFGWGRPSQLPQIYKDFGFNLAVIAKHVSSIRAPQSEFLWRGIDGSVILSTRLGIQARANFFMNVYIPLSTGKLYFTDEFRFDWKNGGIVFHRADSQGYLREYVNPRGELKVHEELLEQCVQAAWDATDETVLKNHRVLMDGSDNTGAQPLLSEIVRLANERITDKQFKICPLREYADKLLELIDPSSLITIDGELRDGPAMKCSANALMTKPFIKTLNKKAENTLFHAAEPFSALYHMLGGDYPRRYLDIAMDYMLKAHPHDSINGVTPEKIVGDTMYRLNQTLEISESVIKRVCGTLIGKIDTGGFQKDDVMLAVFNPSVYDRHEIIRVFVDIPQEQSVWDFTVEDAAGNRYDKQFISRQSRTVPVSSLDCRPWPFYADTYEIFLDIGAIPALGYKVFRLVPTKHFYRKELFWTEMRVSIGDEIGKAVNVLENEFIQATVNPNGTVNIFDKENGKNYENLNHFEDTGDTGDYWIYYPPYHNKTFTSLGAAAQIWMEENGSLSASIGVSFDFQVPSSSQRPQDGVSSESVRSGVMSALNISMRYTLQKNSHKLDVELTVNNTAGDHRLRVLFDTGLDVNHSDAAGHFCVDRRPMMSPIDEKGAFYPEMKTLPHQLFVDVSDGKNGLMLLNNCLTEYEMISGLKGTTLALTLFRAMKNQICTEWRSASAYEDTDTGQCLGEQSYTYAICPHAGNWQAADAYKQAENLNVPLRPYQTAWHEGELPTEGGYLRIIPESLVLSALKIAEERETIILRLFNPTDKTVGGRIELGVPVAEAYLTNMNEERMQKLEHGENSLSIEAKPYKIITLELVF